MKLGPKYKIARRLGAPIFEKTQTQKFALSEGRKTKGRGKGGRGRKKKMSGFALQLLEKQKARFTYGVSERQFSKYAKGSIAKRGVKTTDMLYGFLEMRLDNVIFRAGFAPTRQAARQMVSHGHMMVNGRKVTVPSYQVSVGDVITLRPGSTGKPLFLEISKKLEDMKAPQWIQVSSAKKEAQVKGSPLYEGADTLFDLNSVIEFYSR